MTTVGHIRNELLATFRKNPNIDYSVQTLSRALKLSEGGDFKVLVQALNGMENDNLIHANHEGRYALGGAPKVLTGTFRGNEKGFGFVAVEGLDNDVYVPAMNTDFALDGDTVEVRIVREARPNDSRGPEGEITKIVQRSLTTLVGEFKPFSDKDRAKSGFIGMVVSHEKKLKNFPVYVKDTGNIPQLGDMTVTEITEFPTEYHPKLMYGIVVETLGNKNDPGVDIMSLVMQNHIKTEFPDEVMDQTNAIPDHVTPEERVGRKDITDQAVVTIDGDDSKDFDDAVVVWKLPNGNFHLGVHIADVSHYVTEGSALDQEAFDRGTSTYLVDRVIPMLPFRLSNGICSLNPGVDRLAMSCDMEIDHDGHVVNHEIYQSVIKSHARMTYNNVNKIVTDHDPEVMAEYQELVPMFEDMVELHQILYKMRHARGAIDFEENEAKIIVDDMGHPPDTVLRERGVSERMIESFMLAANETVAEHYNKQHLPFLYRVHETPDADRVKEFMEFIASFGITVPMKKGKEITPKQLQDVVTDVTGTPEEAMVNVKLLRSLKQARYSPDPLGHFGLAAKYYCHFTSPIRRYPDLVVHRLIRDYALEGTTDDVKTSWNKKLPDIATQASMAERRSIDAERAVDDLKKAEYMADKVGEEFDAVVSGVTSFGMFVALPNTVEGLVHITRMSDDYYSFVESQMALVGERTKRTYRIGQSLRVKLDNVDIDQRQVDFSLIPDEKTPTSDLGKLVKKDDRRDRRSNGSRPSFGNNGRGGNRNQPNNQRPQKPAGAPHQGKHYNAKRGTK